MFKDLCEQFKQDLRKIHISGSISLTILNFAHQIELLDEQEVQDFIAILLDVIQAELEKIQGSGEMTGKLIEACEVILEFLNTPETSEELKDTTINQLIVIKQSY